MEKIDIDRAFKRCSENLDFIDQYIVFTATFITMYMVISGFYFHWGFFLTAVIPGFALFLYRKEVIKNG